MNLLAAGQAFLNRTAQASAGVPVAYTRRAGPVAALTPWVGRTLFAGQFQGGARAEWGERDYLLPVADFETAFGAGKRPEKGDRIAEGAVTFELMTPTSEPVWRWSDQTRTLLRVHCKRVA